MLLHGGYGSWNHWIANIPELSENRSIIAPDLPGLGSSATPPKPHLVDNLAEILSDGLNIVLKNGESFHLAGFSFGGLIAIALATIQRHRCLSMTAIGASGFGKLQNSVQGLTIPKSHWPESDKINAHKKNLKLLMLKDSKKIDQLAIHCHADNIHRARLKSRGMSTSEAFLMKLPSVKCRLGGIWGQFDSTAGGEKLIYLRRDIFRYYQPNTLFEVIKGGGHWVMYENPKIFNKLLLDMISSHESPLTSGDGKRQPQILRGLKNG